MYTAIYDSLVQPLPAKVNNHINECLAIPDNGESKDGPLLLKLILLLVPVSMGATVINLHERLTNYHGQMANTSKFNVKAFNEEVTTIMNNLESRGEPASSQEVFNMLFKVCKTVPVDDFNQWRQVFEY